MWETHPLHDLSLKEHLWKLVMLLALMSGQWCQTFTCLDTTAMKKTDDYYVFHLTYHVKQNRPGNVVSLFYVRRYQQELCVYKTLETYLDRTSSLQSGSKLIASYVKPYYPVGTSTIGHWIRQLLLSGIDTTIFAHSTRAASVSKVSNVVPVDTILKRVGWSSNSVFWKFYNKPIVDNNVFQSAVLQ